MIPQNLIDAATRGRWPSGRLPGDLLVEKAPFMSRMDFELLSLAEIRGQAPSTLADLETLTQFAKSPRLALSHRLYSARNAEGPDELPWLDVTQAIIVGGGADHGDDTWIGLDYRRSRNDPPVVISEFRHFGSEENRIAPSQISWCELAPDVAAFIAMIEGHSHRRQAIRRFWQFWR